MRIAKRSYDKSNKEKRYELNQIEGNWEQIKGNVQAQWGRLTDDDIDVIAGNRKALAGKLQELYGKQEEEIDREIDEWMANH